MRCGSAMEMIYSLFFLFFIRIKVLLCTPVILGMPYMFTELAGRLMGSDISCGARKLTRIPRVKKKKNMRNIVGVFKKTEKPIKPRKSERK